MSNIETFRGLATATILSLNAACQPGNIKEAPQEPQAPPPISKVCNVEDPVKKTFSNLYVSGHGKDVLLRASISSTIDYTKPVQHMLVREENVFIWTDIGKTGVIFPIEEDPTGKLINNSLKFDCHAWSFDETKFEIPKKIEFIQFHKAPLTQP